MIEVLEAETDFSLDTEGIIDLIGVDEAEQDVAGTSKEGGLVWFSPRVPPAVRRTINPHTLSTLIFDNGLVSGALTT